MLTVFFEYRIVFSSLNQLIITLDNIINNYSKYLFLFLQYDRYR